MPAADCIGHLESSGSTRPSAERVVLTAAVVQHVHINTNPHRAGHTCRSEGLTSVVALCSPQPRRATGQRWCAGCHRFRSHKELPGTRCCSSMGTHLPSSSAECELSVALPEVSWVRQCPSDPQNCPGASQN